MDPTQPAAHAPSFPFPILLLPLLYFGIFYLLTQASGWSLLARRFRANGPFYGESWNWQSASLRWACNYNRCLTIGASPEAFYLSITPFFRFLSPFTPPLLVPWQEIEVQTGKAFFGLYDTAVLRVGIQERVRIRIGGKLVERLRKAAGPGWPLYAQEQSDAWRKQ